MALHTRIFGWITGYHAYLVRRAEVAEPTTRYTVVRDIAFYWFCLMVPAGLLCWLLDLDQFWRGVVMFPVGVVGLGGMIYSGLVILWAGTRADVRRLDEGRRRLVE